MHMMCATAREGARACCCGARGHTCPFLRLPLFTAVRSFPAAGVALRRSLVNSRQAQISRKQDEIKVSNSPMTDPLHPCMVNVQTCARNTHMDALHDASPFR